MVVGLNKMRGHVQVLVKWWGEYPAWLLNTRVVIPLQHFLTSELAQTKKLTTEVMDTIKVLAKVEEANQLGRQLPPEAFYNELIRWRLALRSLLLAPAPAPMLTGRTV